MGPGEGPPKKAVGSPPCCGSSEPVSIPQRGAPGMVSPLGVTVHPLFSSISPKHTPCHINQDQDRMSQGALSGSLLHRVWWTELEGIPPMVSLAKGTGPRTVG